MPDATGRPTLDPRFAEMDRKRRTRRRDGRERTKSLAYVFLASPLLVVIFGKGQYTVAEAALMPIVGLLMLWWCSRHPVPPEHVVAVNFIHPTGDYDGPDARTEPFYAGMCDCGWIGDDHQTEESARREALDEHTPYVLDGLRSWDV